jgi:hypothetical protein
VSKDYENGIYCTNCQQAMTEGDISSYHALPTDPVELQVQLHALQAELRKEQTLLHKVKGELERTRRENTHLKYNLDRTKSAQNDHLVFNDNCSAPVGLRKLQKSYEDLVVQAEIDKKMKEFLDGQILVLETQMQQLIARNGDLTVQSRVDKQMKAYLFSQWESEKSKNERLKAALKQETRRADDARAQTQADQAMKEYLTRQWEKEEARVKELVRQGLDTEPLV